MGIVVSLIARRTKKEKEKKKKILLSLVQPQRRDYSPKLEWRGGVTKGDMGTVSPANYPC